MGSPYAKFTMTYQEALETDPTIVNGITMDTDAHTEKLRTMLSDRYWDWEIGGETLGVFKAMLLHRFRTIRDYYIELINAYEVKIDMLDGRKTSVIIDEDTTNKDTTTGESKSTGNSDGFSNEFDLPRSTGKEAQPSGKTQNSSMSASTGSSSVISDRKGTRDRTITTTGGENTIEQKKKYLSLLRNIWLELVNDLKPCFLDLYY